jgi:hypothetical protein
MAHIPEDAKWYLAEIVEQITVEGDPRNVVHTNVVLVRADSPEEAYQKAMALGTAGEQSYENPEGKLVVFRFRGLRDLNVIHFELEHGAELNYSEDVGMKESEIQELLPSKEELGVFRRMKASTGPDYRSREIMEEVYERFPHLRPDEPLQ